MGEKYNSLRRLKRQNVELKQKLLDNNIKINDDEK